MKKSHTRDGRLKILRLPVMASGMIITILATSLYIAAPHFVRLIDNRLYDLTVQLALSTFFNRQKVDTVNEIDKHGTLSDTDVKQDRKSSYTSVIVDIDEYSLSHFGQWPWPRYHVAELFRKIHDAGAIAVGIDILFAEPDRTSPVIIQKRMKRDFNIDVTFSEPSQNLINSHHLMDNDILLAQSINKTSATLGYYLNFENHLSESRMESESVTTEMGQPDITGDTPADLPPLDANISFEPGTDPDSIFKYLFNAVECIPPIPVLLYGGEINGENKDIKSGIEKHAGFMNTLSDDDGVLRRTPLFIAWNGKLYPQLALATLLNCRYSGKPESVPTPLITISSNGVESIRFSNTVVPLERNGSMMLNYRGKSHTFPYISAGKILENRVNQDNLKDRIVFIGSSAAGLKDIRMSPLDSNFPGVEVHATIVDNILKNDFILRPDWSVALEVVLTILSGIVTTVLIGRAAPLMTLVATITAGISILLASVWALESQHIWISSLSPLITLSANFAILNLVKYGLSEKEKQFYRTAFGHYVSRSVVNQIIESPEKLNLEGEEREITILFSDIRNFSAISEKLSPSQVSQFLHDYFTPVTRIIINSQGTLDKFIGDAIMCFWNAPLNVDNHRFLALNGAMEILRTLGELTSTFEKEYGVKIKTGVGIHSGVCRVGNMGSADLFDYTAIGDSVNIASRLEGLTKFYGVDLIFSETMIPADRESDIQVQYVDRVRVKGKKEAVNIYTAHCIKSGEEHPGQYGHERGGDKNKKKEPTPITKDHLERYHHAIGLYKSRDFRGAFEIFSELEKRSNYSSKLISIYKERSSEFMKNPPGRGWYGIYNHTSK